MRGFCAHAMVHLASAGYTTFAGDDIRRQFIARALH